MMCSIKKWTPQNKRDDHTSGIWCLCTDQQYSEHWGIAKKWLRTQQYINVHHMTKWLKILTIFCPIGSLQNLQIVRLAVPLLHVQISKIEVDCVADRHKDAPFTPGIVGIRSRVIFGGQDTTLLSQNIMTTAIVCNRN